MTSTASTRRRDALANSERLIAAARKVFASGGQGSLEEIASEAGVGIATLYRHFSGRESLTVASTKVVCDGPGDQRALHVEAATA